MIPELLLLLTAATSAGLRPALSAPPRDPLEAWRQYASPAEAGFDADLLAQARAVAEAADSAAVFVVYRGHVLVAWGDVERRFKCHSVRKSLLSALIGIHVGEGHVDVERTLGELGIDDREPLCATEKTARVVDLLGARSGVYHPAAKEPADMSASRPARGSHAPGTRWWYNNWDFNTLLTVFEQETGTRVFEEFERRIARPIGMQDFRVRDCFYQLEPSKSLHAAYAFRMSARDLARFGQLFLREGRWNDEVVVPADWVAESTRAHSTFDEGGYGYMWWTHPAGNMGASHPMLDEVDAFSARGTGGQFVLVIPAAELVFVHRGDTDNDRRVAGSAIWNMAELVFGAMVDEPAADPELVDVDAVPFDDPGPEPEWPEEVAVDPAVFDELVGEYEILPGRTMTIHVWEDRLFLRSDDGEAELFPEGSRRFFCRAAPVTVEFLEDEAGRITAARIQAPDGDGVVRRL